MELEKSLFRIHDRILAEAGLQKIIKSGFYLFSALAAISIFFLILLNCFESHRQLKFENYETRKIAYNVVPIDWEVVYVLNFTDSELRKNNESHISFKLAQNQSLVTAKEDLLLKYNFSIITIFIDVDEYLNGFNSILKLATNLETMILVDLVKYQFNSTLIVLNQFTNETWTWDFPKIYAHKPVSVTDRFLNSFTMIAKNLFGLFLASIVTSIYIKMTIICSPVVIICIVSCISFCQNEEMQPAVIARAFPWVGDYMIVLSRNLKNSGELINAFLYMIFFFYFFYMFSIFESISWLFDKSFPTGLSDNYFALISFNEFISMICFRTRSSLYFIPKIIMLLNLIFLVYFKSTQYGYYFLAFQATMFLQFSTIFYFLVKFEIPSLNWSALSPYTPTADRPRVYYTPIFNMSWVNDVPQLWTMFNPLCGRRFFQQQSLALVDKNFPLLNNILNQHQNEHQEQNENVQPVQQPPPNILVQDEIVQQLQEAPPQQFVQNQDQQQQLNQLL